MKIQILALVLTVFAVTVNANPKPGLFKSVLKFIKNYVNKKASLESKGKDGKPAFCGKYDCPSFIVKNKTDDYELRCYQKAYWVSTIGYGTRKFTLTESPAMPAYDHLTVTYLFFISIFASIIF